MITMKHLSLTRFLPDLPSRCFAGLLFVYGAVILITVRDYGINPDEESHISYGLSVINWYMSGFQDRRIFTATNTWLYGGFFDTLTYLITQISPLNIFDTRHLCTSAMGILGLVAAYKIGCLLGNKWTGVLAALFLVLTPRYYGHAFNNHKDIPFAVLYLWSIYWQLKILREMPHTPWSWIMAMGGITGLALGIRVGGVMLLCFAGLFWFLKSAKANPKRCILQWCAAFVLAYVVMLLFWPWAQTHPLFHPWKALSEFSQFAHVSTDMLFGGQYLGINEIPWHYAPTWLLLTLPEYVLIGLIAGPLVGFLYWRSTTQTQILSIALLAMSSIAPLLYVMASQTPLYDGVRHILFAILPVVVLSAISLHALARKIKQWRIVLPSVVAICMFTTLWDMITLHPNQYIYFNRAIANGVAQASKSYVTEYWNNSYRQGAEWLTEHASISNDRKIQVHSFPASTRHLLDADTFELTTDPWTADYIFVTTRYDHHRVIPGEVLHIIKAQEVPLLYIIRPDKSFSSDALFAGQSAQRQLYLGVLHRINGQTEQAKEAFEQGLKFDSTNTTLHTELGELYLAAGQPNQALSHFEKAYDYVYHNARLAHKLGLCYERLRAPDKAEALYIRALTLHPYFMLAHRSLGDLLEKQKRYAEALPHYEKIVDIFPESLGDWHRIGVTRQQLGDLNGAAKAWHNLVTQDPTQVDAWLNIAQMSYEQGQLDEALKVYEEVLSIDPNNRRAFFMTGKILLEQKKWDQTIEILTHQLQQDTQATDSYLLLAQAYRHKGQIAPSQQALAKYIGAYNHRLDGWREYFELGKLYQSRGEKQNALLIYRATAEALPDHRELQDSIRALSSPTHTP